MKGSEDTEAENYEGSELAGLSKGGNKSQVALQDDIEDPSLTDMFHMKPKYRLSEGEGAQN